LFLSPFINAGQTLAYLNIHGRILKECTTQIAPILTTLFSLSLKTSKIPDDWRYASVCPAFIKGDKNNPINYRPISLACISFMNMRNNIGPSTVP
jgi:hypothetical protein